MFKLGCIPTKALLESSHLVEKVKKSKDFGINIKDYQIDFKQVIKRSRSVADNMSKGVNFLMKKNKIQTEFGFAKFKNKNTIILDDKKEISSKYFIIATGARPRPFPGLNFSSLFYQARRL